MARGTAELREAGLATQIERLRSVALVGQKRLEIQRLIGLQAAELHRISVLIGEHPAAVRPTLNQRSGQPLPNSIVDVGVPANILRSNPNVRIAEHRYHQAIAQISQVRSSFYPSLSLRGSLTVGLNPSSTEIGVGPQILVPVLPVALREARITMPEARAQEAYLQWRQEVLAAFQNVSTIIVEYNQSGERRRIALNLIDTYVEARRVAQELLDSGTGTTIEILEIERELSAANHTLLAIQRDIGRNYIDLAVAIGNYNGSY